MSSWRQSRIARCHLPIPVLQPSAMTTPLAMPHCRSRNHSARDLSETCVSPSVERKDGSSLWSPCAITCRTVEGVVRAENAVSRSRVRTKFTSITGWSQPALMLPVMPCTKLIDASNELSSPRSTRVISRFFISPSLQRFSSPRRTMMNHASDSPRAGTPTLGRSARPYVVRRNRGAAAAGADGDGPMVARQPSPEDEMDEPGTDCHVESRIHDAADWAGDVTDERRGCGAGSEYGPRARLLAHRHGGELSQRGRRREGAQERAAGRGARDVEVQRTLAQRRRGADRVRGECGEARD